MNNNVINPRHNARQVDRFALQSETLFIYVAIAITSVGFFVFGKSTALQYGAPEWLSWIVGLVAACISAYVTDYAFRHLLEEVVFQALAWMRPTPPEGEKAEVRADQALYFKVLRFLRWVILTAIVGALFYGDWVSVQALRDPFADQAKKKEKTDVTAYTASLGDELNAAVAPLASQMKALERKIAAAEKRVEAGNPGLLSLKKEGNGWAGSELSKQKDKATRDDRKELNKITASYNEALAGNAALLGAATGTVVQENQAADSDNSNQKQSLSTLYFMSGAGAKALSVLLRIFLVVSFLSRNPNLDANGDGKVDHDDVTEAAGGRGGFFGRLFGSGQLRRA